MSTTPLFTHKIGQWTYQIHEDYVIAFNEQEDGSHAFYELRTGPYGNPVFLDEPHCRIQVSDNVDYVNIEHEPVQMDEPAFIAGIICKNDDNKVVARFSLSNPDTENWKFQGESILLESPTGEFWHLDSLIQKDKNRFIGNGYVGVYTPTKPNYIRVMELEDIVRFL
jgi:hypothetical protein